jgi:uncharacterized protein YdaU (DUF1376 family)
MAKDPAFLFYPGDFLTGVQDLTMEERGQYITLLCLQHQKGPLTEKMIRLSCGNAAADVMAKFRQDPAGNFYNERLVEEIEKRAAHAEKQRQRAKSGWEKRKKVADNQFDKENISDSRGIAAAYTTANATANATALPLESENENENENRIGIEKGSEEGKNNSDNIHFLMPQNSKPRRERMAGTVAQNVPELLVVQSFWDNCTCDEKSTLQGWTKEKAYEQAASWYDSMVARGWKVGKAGTPMKDWRAASRTGIRNAVEWGKISPQTGQNSHKSPSTYKSFSSIVGAL